MSIFKRMSDLVRSNVNDVLDKAEDPRKILDQTILDMENEHKKAKKALVDQLALQKQGERQAETFGKQAADWEVKAMAALKAGNESLARTALGEKQKSDNLAAEAKLGAEQQKQAVEDLKASVKQLESKIQEAKGKKDELIARLNAADMKKKQAAIRSGEGKNAVGDSTAFDTFDRMVEKIENSEAEVEARQELLGDAKDPAVEEQLRKLGEASSADAALEALKAKMAAGSAKPAAAAATPPASDANAAAIDDELAKLRAKLEGGGGSGG